MSGLDKARFTMSLYDLHIDAVRPALYIQVKFQPIKCIVFMGLTKKKAPLDNLG